MANKWLAAVPRFLAKQWFMVGLVLSISLAALLPGPGHSGGLLHLDAVTKWGIGLIFFLHGCGLSPSDIRRGLGNWRLHIFVQLTTFVLYPLLWLPLSQLLPAVMPQALAFGFCFLLVLPSTISSSVAMTSIARGNIPGAIFNASFSNLAGIFITPLLVSWFIGASSTGHIEVMQTIIDIAQMLLLPMVLGQLMRPVLIKWTTAHKKIVNKIDKLVILLIVYNAFSDSVEKGIWQGALWPILISVAICVVILFAIVFLLRRVAKKLHFPVEDEIAAVFCGTKKTLAAGVPMAKVIFGNDPQLGMLLLPIMLYHPMQIFYCAILANQYAKRSEPTPSASRKAATSH